MNPLQNKPNVILILADDMGFADLGVTGSEIKTPNIDALAQNGVLVLGIWERIWERLQLISYKRQKL